MNTPLHLLSCYQRHGDADAFCALVRDPAGMVFATARRVTGNAALAEDVAQETFLELARSSHGAVESVSAWLHRVACRKACNAIRGESRRRRHEEAAAKVQLSISKAAWEDLEPLIDEVLEKLPAHLRDPLVQHYLEGRTQQELAARAGISQSTVSRQLDAGIRELRLRLRNVISGAGLATFLSANISQTAPASLTASLFKLAISGAGSAITAGTTTTIGFTITMTTIQKTFIALALTATLGTGIYQSRRASHFRDQLQAVERQQAPFSELLEQLRHDRERSAARLEALQQENERLRGEAGELRGDSQSLAQIKAEDAAAANDPNLHAFLA